MAMILNTTDLDTRADSLTPSEIYWLYNGLDITITHDVLSGIRKQMDDVATATYQHSMELTAPFMEMSLRGMALDLSRRQEVIDHYEEQFSRLQAILNQYTEALGYPTTLNISSPKQLQDFFHTFLGLKEKKLRRKGASVATVTLGREVLESLGANHLVAEPFVNIILAMRDAKKAVGFAKTKFDADSRMRCNFNIAGTNTGRLSSSASDMGTGTNLQNVTGKLKDLFVADPGDVLFDIDLEQGDSRGVGALAWNFFLASHGEEWAGRYLDACESGDLHTTVCQMAWPNLPWQPPVPMDEAAAALYRRKTVAGQIGYRDLTYRDLAKRLGHGTNYLGQPKTMAAHTKVPVRQIEDFQRGYFSGFPCVKEWQNETIRLLQTTRSLTTIFGRRRYFWDDPTAQSTINAAIAYSPQSTTGEFCNRGILQLFRVRNALDLPVKLFLQVHDSTVIGVRWQGVHETMQKVQAALRVTHVLKGGREFTIPNGYKMGWNYGPYDAKTNPYGMKPYDPNESRTPPPRGKTIHSFLDTRVGKLK